MMRWLFFIFSMIFNLNVWAEVKEVVLVADRWCPINCGEDDPKQGVMIDIAKLALHPAGYRVRYIEMPWQRALAMTRVGEVHGVVGAYRDDAPDFLFPRHPLMVISGNTLFTRSESDWVYMDLSSLDNMRLGAVRGYAYGKGLDEYIKKHTLDASRIHMLTGRNPIERNIKLLVSGRIDVIADSPPVVWHTAKNLKVSKFIREAGQATKAAETFIAFSPTHIETKAILKAFDEGVSALRRNGTMEQLLASYGLPRSVLPKIPDYPDK